MSPTIGLSQIAGAQFLHVYKPRNWINCGQAGPLGWTLPAALGVRAADPDREIVALSGDYDFQFMIEELAVGAQHKLPYIHVVVNNSYLGLIRQAQRGFEMDYRGQLAFENINAPTSSSGYGVDHVAVAEGLGCKAIRVTSPNEFAGGVRARRSELMAEHQVPVVVEFILERVTNISMGTEIDNDHRVRGGPGSAARRRAGCADRALRRHARLHGRIGETASCRNLPPISPCCSTKCRSSTASPRRKAAGFAGVEYPVPL